MATLHHAVWLRFDAYRQKANVIALPAFGAAAVVFVGVLGVASDSGLRKLAETRVNLHALFGLLLCAWVIARLHGRVKAMPPRRPADFRDLTRYLSRWVYLCLYLVIGAKQAAGIVDSLSSGSEFGLGPGSGAADATKDFQAILLYGIVTLVLIRAMTFSLSLRARRQQPMPHDFK